MIVKERFVVVGPGAMGLLISACLCRAGLDVTVFDYKATRAERLLKEGIRVVEPDGKTWNARPKVSLSADSVQDAAFVILCVKSYNLEGVLSSFKGALNPDTVLCAIQNGIGHWKIMAAHAPQNPLLVCSISQGATLMEPCKIFHAGIGPTFIGPVFSDKEHEKRALELSRLLSDADWPTSFVSDIYPVVWRKLLVNCAINPLTALTRLKNGALLGCPELVMLQDKIAKEVLAVSRAENVAIGLTHSKAIGLIQEVCKKTSKNISSMLQDVLRGKETEIDFINGAVARLGKRHNVPTPVNETLTALIKGIKKEVSFTR